MKNTAHTFHDAHSECVLNVLPTQPHHNGGIQMTAPIKEKSKWSKIAFVPWDNRLGSNISLYDAGNVKCAKPLTLKLLTMKQDLHFKNWFRKSILLRGWKYNCVWRVVTSWEQKIPHRILLTNRASPQNYTAHLNNCRRGTLACLIHG